MRSSSSEFVWDPPLPQFLQKKPGLKEQLSALHRAIMKGNAGSLTTTNQICRTRDKKIILYRIIKAYWMNRGGVGGGGCKLSGEGSKNRHRDETGFKRVVRNKLTNEKAVKPLSIF